MKQFDLLEAFAGLNEKYEREAQAHEDALKQPAQKEMQPVTGERITVSHGRLHRILSAAAAFAVVAGLAGSVALLLRNGRPGTVPGTDLSSEDSTNTIAKVNMLGGEGTLLRRSPDLLEDDTNWYLWLLRAKVNKKTGEMSPLCTIPGCTHDEDSDTDPCPIFKLMRWNNNIDNLYCTDGMTGEVMRMTGETFESRETLFHVSDLPLQDGEVSNTEYQDYIRPVAPLSIVQRLGDSTYYAVTMGLRKEAQGELTLYDALFFVNTASDPPEVVRAAEPCAGLWTNYPQDQVFRLDADTKTVSCLCLDYDEQLILQKHVDLMTGETVSVDCAVMPERIVSCLHSDIWNPTFYAEDGKFCYLEAGEYFTMDYYDSIEAAKAAGPNMYTHDLGEGAYALGILGGKLYCYTPNSIFAADINGVRSDEVRFTYEAPKGFDKYGHTFSYGLADPDTIWMMYPETVDILNVETGEVIRSTRTDDYREDYVKETDTPDDSSSDSGNDSETETVSELNPGIDYDFFLLSDTPERARMIFLNKNPDRPLCILGSYTLAHDGTEMEPTVSELPSIESEFTTEPLILDFDWTSTFGTLESGEDYELSLTLSTADPAADPNGFIVSLSPTQSTYETALWSNIWGGGDGKLQLVLTNNMPEQPMTVKGRFQLYDKDMNPITLSDYHKAQIPETVITEDSVFLTFDLGKDCEKLTPGLFYIVAFDVTLADGTEVPQLISFRAEPINTAMYQTN